MSLPNHIQQLIYHYAIKDEVTHHYPPEYSPFGNADQWAAKGWQANNNGLCTCWHLLRTSVTVRTNLAKAVEMHGTEVQQQSFTELWQYWSWMNHALIHRFGHDEDWMREDEEKVQEYTESLWMSGDDNGMLLWMECEEQKVQKNSDIFGDGW